MGNKSKKNRPVKSQVIFNEDDRANYLLGFRKRKQERKKKARTELEDMIKKEKKRQKELKAQAILDERKKAGLPMFDDKIKVSKRDVIDTGDNEIIISDFSSSNPAPVLNSDNEDEQMLQSEKTDAEINQTKVKISKECSLISEKIGKLEKQRRALEQTNSKTKKNYLKSRQNSKNSKSSKKFNINRSKQKKKLKKNK